tara:strand:- start:763 stop:1551 length:789 start_codon:yes stop_codon:yes gene_type:complete
MKFFLHATRQLFGNFRDALRIGGVLIMFFLIEDVGVATGVLQGEVNPQGYKLNFALQIFSLYFGAIVAIVWHRFILCGERGDIAQEFGRKGRERGYPYFGRLLLISFLALVPAAAIFFLIGDVILPAFDIPIGYVRLGQFTPLFGFWLTLFCAGLMLLWVANRLSLSLPAVALDTRISLRAAWRQTSPHSIDIFVFCLLFLCVGAAFIFVAELLPPLAVDNTVARVAIASITSFGTWVTTMLSISLLTTIYGHAVEGRPLNA